MIMKKSLMLLFFAATAICAKSNDAKKEMKKPVDAQHSNIHLLKVTNKSPHDIFFAAERSHIMPMSAEINLSGHIMPEKAFEITDPEGVNHAIMIPVWQSTFRGNTINVVSLSGKPGRIYYLYVIDNHLWAIKAPSKEGELKGVHLLAPSEDDRQIELEVHNNNVLQVHVVDENGKRNGESTQLAFDDDADNYIAQKEQEQRYVK